MTDDSPKAGKTFFTNNVWAIATRMSIRFLGVISIIILAGLLSSDDFGIVAKAVMTHAFLELVSSPGLETALITGQKASKEHYKTVWTLQILRGMLIGLILAALEGPAAVYFHEPELTITIAFIWQPYWVLATGVAAAMLTTIISSFIMSSYRPKLTILKWRDLFHFEKRKYLRYG